MTTHGREIPCTWSNWTAAAGWIAQHFYDHYLFTGDLASSFAERAVPWLAQGGGVLRGLPYVEG
jgi:hypothetical protein